VFEQSVVKTGQAAARYCIYPSWAISAQPWKLETLQDLVSRINEHGSPK